MLVGCIPILLSTQPEAQCARAHTCTHTPHTACSVTSDVFEFRSNMASVGSNTSMWPEAMQLHKAERQKTQRSIPGAQQWSRNRKMNRTLQTQWTYWGSTVLQHTGGITESLWFIPSVHLFSSSKISHRHILPTFTNSDMLLKSDILWNEHQMLNLKVWAL